jgi:AraC family transcriptional regulator, melibiose operon regulatory protein
VYVHRGSVHAMNSFHAHFEVEVNYVFEGYMKYFMGQTEFTLTPRKLCAFWGSTPHRLIEVGPKTQAGILTVPTVWFNQWALPRRLTQTLFEGGILIESDFQTESSRVELWCRDFTSPDISVRLATQLEIQAAFFRMMPRSLEESWETGFPVDVTPVMGMCRYIRANLGDFLSSVEIAEVVGLHPSYAARVFRKLTGMGIQDYIMQQRVSTAQRLLITTEENVENIGNYAGFQSSSQFFTSFKKVTGQTPLQFRKQSLRPVAAK